MNPRTLMCEAELSVHPVFAIPRQVTRRCDRVVADCVAVGNEKVVARPVGHAPPEVQRDVVGEVLHIEVLGKFVVVHRVRHVACDQCVRQVIPTSRVAVGCLAVIAEIPALVVTAEVGRGELVIGPFSHVVQTPVHTVQIQVDEGSVRPVSTHGDLGVAVGLIFGVRHRVGVVITSPRSLVTTSKDHGADLIGCRIRIVRRLLQ